MSLQQLLLILRARARIAGGVLAAVLVTTIAVSLLLPRQYTAETSLVVDAKSIDPLLGVVLPGQMLPGYMATQADIVNSDRVAQRVVSMLRLDEVPLVRQQWTEETEGQGDIRVWLGELLKNRLDARPSRESNVINISYTGGDPQFAAAVANAFAQAFIAINLELKVEPAREYARWFDERSGPLRRDVEAAQKRLSEYQLQHGIVATDERLDVENARLAELSSQLVAAEAQHVDSRSRQKQAAALDTLPEVLQNGLIQGLKVELARQEGLRQQLASRVGRNHPDYRRASAEIDSLQGRIAAETARVARSIGTISRVDDARATDLREALEAQKQRVLALRAERDRIAVLQRDVEAAQRAYDLVAQRLAQTSLESQNQQTNVSVLTAATAPLKHSSPRLVLNTVLALFLGGVLGVGAAVVLEMLDQRIRGPEDLRQLTGTPLLSIIPAK